MKKLLVLALCLAGAAAFWILTLESDGLPCIKCLSGGVTAPAWGMGSTCQAAIADAIFEAEALIPGWCDVCGSTPIEVTSCYQCGQGHQTACTTNCCADYKVAYRCLENLCIP